MYMRKRSGLTGTYAVKHANSSRLSKSVGTAYDASGNRVSNP